VTGEDAVMDGNNIVREKRSRLYFYYIQATSRKVGGRRSRIFMYDDISERVCVCIL
jgi:hypothetical protein